MARLMESPKEPLKKELQKAWWLATNWGWQLVWRMVKEMVLQMANSSDQRSAQSKGGWREFQTEQWSMSVKGQQTGEKTVRMKEWLKSEWRWALGWCWGHRLDCWSE